MTLDISWYRSQIVAYREIRPRYEEYARLLKAILESQVKPLLPLAMIDARAKSVRSFAEKVVRKANKYSDPARQLTDLCGARIIVHTLDEVDLVCGLIRNRFAVDEANSLDARERLAAAEFGYRSVHYVVQLKRDDPAAQTVPEEVSGLKAEIQVRTLAQHAWADMGHDRLYKSLFRVPEQWYREAARAAAVLEQADETLTRLVARVDDYRLRYDAYMQQEQMDQELQRLLVVWEELATPDLALARQIARLLCCLNRWEQVVKFVDSIEAPSAELVLLSGWAVCQQHGADRSSAGYGEGRRRLAEAQQREPKKVEAMLLLAESWEGIDERQADEWYERAFRLEPSHPRVLCEYVTRVIARKLTWGMVEVLRPTLEKAVAECSEQIRIGVNLPDAYFWRGLLQLLCPLPFDSLASYTDGLRHRPAEHLLDRALQQVERLRQGREPLEASQWAWHMLLLAKAVRDHRLPPALQATEAAGLLQAPVVIVAGGCDPAFQEEIGRFRPLLQAAFAGFEGTVVSGGTQQGVSGLVGELVEANRGRLRAVGYIPEHLPWDASLDRRYDRLQPLADRAGFSPAEPLQNWIDLLAAGIDPNSVLVLGINGGRIAMFEYRLALALGATVGLIQDSGRAAGKFAQEQQYERIERLIMLPPDPLTVREFVHSVSQPRLLPDDVLEQVARDLQEIYRKDHQERFLREKPEARRWDEGLPDEYKRSCLAQAAHIPIKLAALGLQAVPVSGRPIQLYEFPKPDEEQLAEMEHARWNFERLRDGWTLGEKSLEKKQSPYLVPWEELPETVRDWDRNFVRAIPDLLRRHGFEIQPLSGAGKAGRFAST